MQRNPLSYTNQHINHIYFLHYCHCMKSSSQSAHVDVITQSDLNFLHQLVYYVIFFVVCWTWPPSCGQRRNYRRKHTWMMTPPSSPPPQCTVGNQHKPRRNELIDLFWRVVAVKRERWKVRENNKVQLYLSRHIPKPGSALRVRVSCTWLVFISSHASRLLKQRLYCLLAFEKRPTC